MSLVNWLRRPIIVRQIAIWALEVARRSHPEVSVRLGQKLYRMSLPEARGYIRARAAEGLEEELAQLVQQTGCNQALADAVRRRAILEITRLAIGDMLKSTRHTPSFRRAA